MDVRVVMIPLAVVYLLALCALLWVARKNRGLYALAKGICSGLFLACVLAAFLLGGRQRPLEFALLALALCMCAFGDILLGVANKTKHKVSKKPFVVGAVSFMLAHAVFCALFFLRSPLKWYDFILALLLLGLLRLLEAKDKIRLKKMRTVGYIYTFMVGMMAWKAAESVLSAGLFSLHGLCVVLGAFLFLTSDVLLLFMYFGTKRIRLIRGFNLVTYYLGVFLLAFSAYWL